MDGLTAEGHKLHLANTAAIQQYEGLKYTDDHSDARWLAHLLRLEVSPQGDVDPRADRPVRDLLRKRSQMVRHRTIHLLSIQNLLTRNTGSSLSANEIEGLDVRQVDQLLTEPDLALAVKASLAVMSRADEQSRCSNRPSHDESSFVLSSAFSDPCLDRVRFSRSRLCWRPATSGDLPVWRLCIVLPLCGQSEDQQRQEKRPGQYRERQQVSGLGIYRSSPLRHPIHLQDEELL